MRSRGSFVVPHTRLTIVVRIDTEHVAGGTVKYQKTQAGDSASLTPRSISLIDGAFATPRRTRINTSPQRSVHKKSASAAASRGIHVLGDPYSGGRSSMP